MVTGIPEYGDGETVTCSRCAVPLVPGGGYIGSWLARDVPVPRIGQDGPRPGLCPDGEPHEAAGRG